MGNSAPSSDSSTTSLTPPPPPPPLPGTDDLPTPPVNQAQPEMTEQDKAFSVWAESRLRVLTIGGAALSGGAVYGILRWQTGRMRSWLHWTAIGGAAVGGALGGFLKFSSEAVREIEKLDNKSAWKKVANQVLINRYPMAVHSTMEQRKAQKAGQQSK